jgi:hypothetical protein
MRGPEGASVQQCTGATRHLVRLLAEIHGQVAGLLGGPVPGWMQRDSQDVDAPAGVLDHGQVALAGEPRAEGATRVPPGALGLDRAPEVKTIRRKLGELASAARQPSW